MGRVSMETSGAWRRGVAAGRGGGAWRRGVVALWLASPQAALAVCRVVLPLEESGDPGVVFDPLTTVVMVRAPEQHVGWRCPEGVFARPLFATGCSADDDYYRPGLDTFDAGRITYSRDGGGEEQDVVVYETIPIGDEYEVTVLNASSLFALTQWMDERQLAHDEVDDAAFERYIGEDQWFVAVQVQPPPTDEAMTTKRELPPIVVSYVGGELPIAHELTYEPAGGVVETDLLVPAPEPMRVEDGDARPIAAHRFALSAFDPEHRALRGARPPHPRSARTRPTRTPTTTTTGAR